MIIRGGGSFESLQAFNNEALVRMIADFRTPIICGIGHDKDVPLASLAADKAVSTPTAVTALLNRSWEKAIHEVLVLEKDLIYKYQSMLEAIARRIESFSDKLLRFFSVIFQIFGTLRRAIENSLSDIVYELKDARKTLSLLSKSLLDNLARGLENQNKMLEDVERQLRVFNPIRQLALGYSIVSVAGKVVKIVKQVNRGENLDIRVSDGTIKSTIDDIKQQ